LGSGGGGAPNGPVLALARVAKGAMAPAAGAGFGALHLGGQGAVGLGGTLKAMGSPLLSAPIGTMGQERPKAMGMRSHWARGRAGQGQFRVYWGPGGGNNFGGYYTKHYPPVYHKRMWPIHTCIGGLSPETLQGCIGIMTKTDLVKSSTLMRQ